MIYLASPYSAKSKSVMKKRYRAACKATAILVGLYGYPVYSPIVHSHPLVEFNVPTEWKFWKSYDSEMLKSFDMLWVFRLDGWDESVGVYEEVKIARRLKINIQYIQFDHIFRICFDGSGDQNLNAFLKAKLPRRA